VTRLTRLVLVPALALAAVGCSTGRTLAPPGPSTASASASASPSTEPGFPTDEDGPVLDAARTFVETATTYDHTKLGDQLKALLPLAGQPLKGTLASSFADNGNFATTVKNSSRDSKGTVIDLGLVSRADDRAVVIVFVDQVITSPDANGTQKLRERVTLSRSGGKWLATKLEPL
jgi:hypothetical protein